ncbi:MAG: FtsQ-type POTRA domain-containing protein [bacterium]
MKRRSQKVIVRKKKKNESKKKRVTLSAFILFFLSLGLLAYFGFKNLPYLVQNLEVLKIKEIIVKGELKKEKIDDIYEMLSVLDESSILSFKEDKLQKQLLGEFPGLKLENCRYHIPNKLVVELKQRKGIALIAENGNYLEVDREGILYPMISESSLPEIRVEEGLSEEPVIEFLKIWEDQKLALSVPIKKLALNRNNDLELYLENGVKIAWGTLSCDVEKIIDCFNRLEVVMNNAEDRFGQLKYINLRYMEDGRVLVRPVDKQNKI